MPVRLWNRQSLRCTNCRGKMASKRIAHPSWPGLSRSRQQQLWSKHRLRPADYLDMFCRQGGRCAISGEMLPTLWYNAVDHDHKTGAVRGLLLDSFNLGLGQFRDSPAHLLQAADYLKRCTGTL